ncbi:MucR family transcriptional regulator [Methylobacterium durans]|uniref:MucR family transcriptional regulator n=1 Tax=Methylobacterium durans TaxID=2202825 RepID=A0A2U8W8R6_9HYPH|nr:MucR family transcriptional regulator [Methylobacterium durans]AWN42523.1 MucR family transcriptional regulator [Methylobacterium durans]
MPEETQGDSPQLTAIAADLVSAYVANNPVPPAELPALIARVHAALDGLASGLRHLPADEQPKPTPTQVRRSVTPDALISFLDGKPYKTLKRHLAKHGLEPNSYRERYGLPRDYPMVCPNYSEQRSALARNLGLGRPGGGASQIGGDEAAPTPAARTGRGRRATWP